MNIDDKIEIVKDILRDKKIAIGFSGGADSTLMTYLASQVAKDVLAITIDNHLMGENFINHTQKVAIQFGVKQHIIDLNFYEDSDFLENSPARCYGCRNWMYTNIKNYAEKEGFDFICDGNNISDLVIDRPGILVTYKKGFNTPFIEAKLTSKEIHQYLNEHNIPYSRSTTCLATRIPTNTQVKMKDIDRIRHCEHFIQSNFNCQIVKVRDMGDVCIVEVENFDEVITQDSLKQINNELKSQGFKKVCLNLTPIDDDDDIILNYHDGCFNYQLPFTINIENTIKQLSQKIIKSSNDEIKIKNLSINKNGLIKGTEFNSYDEALDSFMDLLSAIRRNI